MFNSSLDVVAIEDKPDLWYLAQPLIFTSASVRIVIPQFFITDLASIPHFIDWIPFLDRTGLSRRAAALHDGIYSLGRERGKDFADAMLREALLSDGLTRFQAGCYYEAVCLFGKYCYAEDAREGTFGAITSGDFFTQQAFDDWKAAGGTIFQPLGR